MITQYFSIIFSIILKAYPFILIGIFINLLFEKFVNKKNLLSNFEKNDIKTVLRASVNGFLISGLSFGVVPLLVSLKQNKASKSAIVAMLLSTPWTGALGLMIIGGYLGFYNLLILLACSFSLSFIGGILFLILEKMNIIKNETKIKKQYLTKNNYKNFKKYLTKKTTTKELSISLTELIKNLFIAILFTAFFKIIFSQEIINLTFSSQYSFLYAIPLATLIEIIGEGFTIFAGELFLLNANLGAVFSIILSAVITDINELSMLANIFSKKSATFYLIMSIILTIIFSIMLI